ncbi:hypothetical protein JCM11491_004353 [Sporobolomyces phaffii]
MESHSFEMPRVQSCIEQEDTGGMAGTITSREGLHAAAKLDGIAKHRAAPPVESEAAAALRINRNKIANDSGSDMDTGNSSYESDSLSSAESDTAAEVVTSKLKTPTRTTRIFSPTKLFDTAEHFFDSCRKRLLARYGHATHRYQNTSSHCDAVCSQRRKGCVFQIHVHRKGSGEWSIDGDKCRWTHNHDAGKPERTSRGEESDSTTSEPGNEDGSGSSSSEEEPLVKRVAAHVIKWDVATQSEVVRGIVSKREEIFAKQRSFAGSPLQDKSAVLVDHELQRLPIPSHASLPVYHYEHVKFLKFTEKANVPPYPISSPLIALYLVYKSALVGGMPACARSWLNKLRRLLQDTWQDNPVYQGLDSWEDAEEGIREFMSERSNARIRRASKATASAKTATKPPPPKRSRVTEPFLSDEYESDLEVISEDDSEDSDWRSTTRTSPSPSSSGGSSEIGSDDGTGNSGCEETSTGSHRQLIPGLPAVNQSFSSANAAYRVLVRLNVRALGINVERIQLGRAYTIRCARRHSRHAHDATGRCGFAIIIELDDTTGRWIVQPESQFEHNHGPATALLADPSYMPRIVNKHARKALGLAALTTDVPANPRKKHKRSSSAITSKDETAHTRDQQKRKKEQMRQKAKAQFEALSTVFAQEPVQQVYPSPAPSFETMKPRRPSVHRSQVHISASPPLPARAQSSVETTLVPCASDGDHDTSPNAPLFIPNSATPIVSVAGPLVGHSKSFLPTLTAFLSGLHPSLVSLAPALFANGVDSFDSLSGLVSYERCSLDRFVLELQKLHRLSIVHVKLLVQTLSLAKEGGFGV